ncbi:MAG TPA: peptidoglycan-binding protein [Bryobacterales bacterium]|nr:peptidoglycan-binding protein [Bryobacterales bacterium]
MTSLQKKTAKAIVNIFETSRVLGNYSSVTLLAGDTGHLTYGRSQTTLGSGNLHLLIKAYTQAPEAAFAAHLAPFLGRLEARDFSLDHDLAFRLLLQDAGRDPVMRAVQDEFFDRVYWVPAEMNATALGIATALGGGVVYDSTVHGSWRFIRDRTHDRHGDVPSLGEKKWIEAYVGERDSWLRHHANPLLRRTVYRMEEFVKLITDKKWALPLALKVRGLSITKEALADETGLRVSAEEGRDRLLRFTTPLMTGDDIAEIQRALNKTGFNLQPDGVFGRNTEAAVRRFQQQTRLAADGIVGNATRAALGI